MSVLVLCVLSVRQKPMNKAKVIVSLTAGLMLAVAGTMIGGNAQAAVISPEGLRPAADELAAINKVAFIYRGRRFWWYNTGWRGPGWYWCGYRWRRGFGWGGPVGWRGWRRPGVHRPGANWPSVNRPGGNRPSVNRPGGNRPSVNRPGGNRPGAGARPGGRPGGSGSGGNRRGGGGGNRRGSSG